MATAEKKRMRETKGAGIARLLAVTLRLIAATAHGLGEALRIMEKVLLQSADALMLTIATEDK